MVVLDHRVRHVDVQVERSDDRHVRPDDGADAAQQLALGVVVAVGHHRAVQLDEDHVGAAAAIAVDQRGAHALERVRGDRAGGLRHAHAIGTTLWPALRTSSTKQGRPMFRPVDGLEHRLAFAGAGPGAGAREIVPGGRRVDEGRAFVQEAADRDAQSACVSAPRAAP